ncbi:hypothetical protein DFO80_10969 [Rhodobacter sp. 140A]|nr:hypothetical protein DFO80_10969 [Rhodobacter sp. 140A]
MVRGLIAGLATGGVVAVLGLGALSLVAPLPRPNATTPPASATGEDAPAARGVAPRTPRLPVPANSPAPIAAAPRPTAPSAPHPPIAPAAPLAEAPAPSLPPPVALAGAGDAAPVAPAGEGVTAAEPVAPTAPAPVAEPAATPLPGTESAARPDAVATAPASPAAPEPPLAMREPGAEAPVPVPPPGEVVAPELPQAEADEAAVARTVPAPAAPAAPPAAAADDDAAPATPRAPEPGQEIVLLPDGAIVPPAAQLPRVFSPGDAPQGFANAPGTAVNRLPTIGDETQVATAPAPGFLRPPGAEAPAGALAGGPPPATAAVPAPRGDEAPIRRYGAAFTPEPGKPLFSVVLIDPGTAAGGLDSGTIKALGLPLTIAIDPTRPDAATAAAAYRAAGLEVAILASPLPEGATAQDLEVALEAWRAVLPEAVAVVEPPKPVVQNNRLLSQDLVAVLAREGLGLVTQSSGTNAAEQLARAAGLPEVRVWRVLDADRERGTVVERTLARAAFEAARDGAVTVMLSAWPESISGLTSWSVGATGTVSFAPVSALALAQTQNGG